jgi:uncharacterized protein (TIGR02246 family)
MDAKVEARLRALEDRQAIYQLVCGYGYAVDGRNGPAVGALYAEDGVYAVADSNTWQGRDVVASIVDDPGHAERVGQGVAHVSTLPYVVLDGDRATATCHTVLLQHGQDGYFIGRLSASRLQLSRKPGGGWQIDHRQNYLLNGDPAASALLGRLMEGPA